MNITVIGRKCTPRENFKERADKKLSKLDKFFSANAEAKVTATVEKKSQSVEVTVNNDGMVFRAQARAENMNDALDRCVDLLVRQIRKNKTRLEKRIHSEALSDFVFDDEVQEETSYEIVRTKSIAVKPQSVEEAILQMNMLGHHFYMFRNAADNKIALVYSREDGGYGLIIPEE